MVKQTVSFKVADKECCNFIKMSLGTSYSGHGSWLHGDAFRKRFWDSDLNPIQIRPFSGGLGYSKSSLCFFHMTWAIRGNKG